MARKSRYKAYVEGIRSFTDFKRAKEICEKVSVLKRLKELKGSKS